MSARYFPNNFTDYQGESYLADANQLNPKLSSTIIQWIGKQMNQLEENLSQVDRSDGSVYTGGAGIALLYYRLGQLFPDQRNQNLNKAKELIKRALKCADNRVATFLCGEAGPMALAAVLSYHMGDENSMKTYIDKIVSMRRIALSRSTPDEFLYGRSGYLSTLLFLRRELGDQSVDDSLISEIFETIIRSGEHYARQVKSRSPLMYSWCDTEYLGAAHGLSGIIYLLLKISQHPSFVHLQRYTQTHLIPTVEYLKNKQLSSGNYMSSNDSKSDHLVQWCHGAPGFVFMFLQAYQMTKNPSYLERAIAAGDVVWQRGLLRKGYGLCHGAAGNAYVFLDLYKMTNDLKWLHRAIKYGEFCLDYGKHHLSRTPDCSFSLFEGLAGTICFISDLLHPLSARFPCFDD